MNKTVVVTKSGYVGENIRPVNPVNKSIPTKSATGQPVFKRFIINEDEELSEGERIGLVNPVKERNNADVHDIYKTMTSWPNKVRDNLEEQNKSR